MKTLDIPNLFLDSLIKHKEKAWILLLSAKHFILLFSVLVKGDI